MALPVVAHLFHPVLRCILPVLTEVTGTVLQQGIGVTESSSLVTAAAAGVTEGRCGGGVTVSVGLSPSVRPRLITSR